VIVVDTNVLLYLRIEGPHTKAAERLLAADPEWASPLLWRSEFRNVLVGYVRRGKLRLAEALELMADAERQLVERELEVSSADVLELSVASKCSAYDREFVALARTLGVPLFTADAAIVSAFPRVARRLE
jgi:predicted nucleic acid-binding protein